MLVSFNVYMMKLWEVINAEIIFFKVIKVTPTKFIFGPYLINIRYSLSLKYGIQLEVPLLKKYFLGTVRVLNAA